MPKSEKIQIDPKLAKDPNYIAYCEAKERGDFDSLSKVAWVLFVKGIYKGSSETFDGILAIERDSEGFIDQPNMPERVIDVSTPLSIED